MSVSESSVRPILAEAVALARRALLELQPTGVGEHLGVIGEDECAATHRFAATLPGYRGWRWEVVVAAAPDAAYATVSESALLPGPGALVAPEFVPWDQRVRPGDLHPGDLLAPRVGDPRLVPGYVQTGDPAADEVCEEIGLGRRQVLSREGRLEAGERWYAEFGPEAEMARSAPGTCGVCGFFVPLAGAMRAAFGVCANPMGADGRVVHVGYGCGAHSDTEVPTGAGSPRYEPYDDAAVETVTVAPPSRGEPEGDEGSGAEQNSIAPDNEPQGASNANASAVTSTGPASAPADAGRADAASSVSNTSDAGDRTGAAGGDPSDAEDSDPASNSNADATVAAPAGTASASGDTEMGGPVPASSSADVRDAASGSDVPSGDETQSADRTDSTAGEQS